VLQTCIKKVLASIIGWNTSYPEVNSDFPQSFHANAGIVSRLCHYRLLQNHLQVLLDLASAVILKSESRGSHDHILLPQIRDSPYLEGQVPVFISPSNRVARFYPQTMGSFLRLLRLAGLRWLFDLASTRDTRALNLLQSPLSVAW
jgi:hypothetical protein